MATETPVVGNNGVSTGQETGDAVPVPAVPVAPVPEPVLPEPTVPEPPLPEPSAPVPATPVPANLGAVSEPAAAIDVPQAPTATGAPDLAGSGGAPTVDPVITTADAPPPAKLAPAPEVPADVLSASDPPVAGVVADFAALPELPESIQPVVPQAPAGLVAPDAVPSAAVTAVDVPPPPAQEVLLEPSPAPRADPAPARVAPEQTPGPVAVPAPATAQPVPDLAPDLPVAKPLPPPLQQAELDVAEPDGQTDEAPDPGLQPVKPIISDGAARTLAPDEGLPGTDGVKVGQLPKIVPADVPVATEGAAQLVPDANAPPIERFARAFENPDGKPLFAVLLRDTGAPELDRAALAQIAFPVTFVIDPLTPGAAAAAEIYRGAGQEVLMLASGIPQGATASDLEQSFQAMAGVLPQSVGMIDQSSDGFQGNRPLAAQVVPLLAAQGRGLVTFDAGLNAADQEARRAELPSALVFRRLDADGEATSTIRRYLDRAAFKAAQEGRVVVLGDARPETVAALMEWTVEGRAASVALAPITAVMTAP